MPRAEMRDQAAKWAEQTQKVIAGMGKWPAGIPYPHQGEQ